MPTARGKKVAAGLGVGLVVALGFQLTAADAATVKPREDQLVILAQHHQAPNYTDSFSSVCHRDGDYHSFGTGCGTDVNLLGPSGLNNNLVVQFDGRNYGPSAVQRLEVAGYHQPSTPMRLCWRLYDVSKSAPIAGSETCYTWSGSEDPASGNGTFFRVRGNPVRFSGAQTLTIQESLIATDPSAPVAYDGSQSPAKLSAARVIVNWSDSS